jgi:hypothetical protein
MSLLSRATKKASWMGSQCRPLHQDSLVIEMIAHEPLEPRDKESELDGLAMDGPKPPVRDGLVVGIDHVVTERVLSAEQWARGAMGHDTCPRFRNNTSASPPQ